MQYKDIVTTLVQARLEQKVTKYELAKKTGLSQVTIANFEKGNNATVDVIAKISEALGFEFLIRKK